MSRRSSIASSGSAAKRAGAKAASKRGRKASAAKSGAKVLHLDLFSGIAGNMFLGALLDAGLSRRELEQDLEGLGTPHKLRVRKVQRGALTARYVDVVVPGAAQHKASHQHGHHSHGRHYAEIVRLIEGAKLDSAVRLRALAIFEALGRAEARVHGVALDKVHFHEVGAVDAIVDVTAACIGLERLGISFVTASPVALGEGSVETDHGKLPLPAPATLELLRGIPTVPAHVPWETVTPTGAAILRTIVDEFGCMPAMRVDSIGHGAGNDRPGAMPNVVRAVVGRAGALGTDRVTVLETNLDDLVPEHFDYLMERLFEAGALDVGVQHLQMKKNRPGFLVRVIAKPSDRDALARILFAESTAIGVRMSGWDRFVLQREKRTVDTKYGRIGIKVIASVDGGETLSAEYDDCKRAAKKSGAALRDVVRAAERAGRREV